jgi:prepilin-type N-terminal cleavage/methylation domain-containing protein/prepilin-type processing-associated H-X9-DG protein
VFHNNKAFSLIELLIVIAVTGILSVLLIPGIQRVRQSGASSFCRSNLHQMYAAYMMYLDDHAGRFFPWREDLQGGTLWYWGYEKTGGAEGARELDKSQARLAPYFNHVGGIEVCPSFPYQATGTKQKFEVASYGYGINVYLLSDTPANRTSGVRSFWQIEIPAETIVWGDSAQINTWQAPASSRNPMLEEWYYISRDTPPNVHFRHNRQANMVMADGSIRSFAPNRLDPRCDGLTGYIEPAGRDYYLRPVK